uniref:DUF4371 domain-containing protein n=1 Tax=Xiphophorus maculatus TaxID=8083 RepID=A0A3B5QKP1_XIPMA
ISKKKKKGCAPLRSASFIILAMLVLIDRVMVSLWCLEPTLTISQTPFTRVRICQLLFIFSVERSETGRKQKVEENKKYIKTVAEVLLLTATQNIAQRGHSESDDSDNKGNFLAVLNEIAKHDPFVQRRLDAHGNAKYTSHQIQNEILQGLAEMVQKEIIAEVKQSEVFSVLADETRDLQKKEQISLVVRYYYSGAIHESFLHFQSADSLDAEDLTKMIVGCLEKHGLDYRNNLVGQGYDGASVMSGKHSGVAARIKNDAKFAFYVHCNAHCLNLVLVDVVKSVPEAEDFFSLLQNIYKFVTGSAVHTKWLAVQKELYPQEKPRELQRLIDVRWACRYLACRNVRDRLPAVLRLLLDISLENNSGDRKVEAKGLLAQIDFQFIALLVTFCKVLGDIKILSDMLQSSNLDLSKAVDLVGSLTDTLKSYRSEACFGELLRDTQELVECCKISTLPLSKRQPKASSRFLDSLVMTTVGQRHSDQSNEDFNRGLERRFSQKNCEIMQGVQSPVPKSPLFLKEETLYAFGQTFERLLLRREKGELERPSTLLDFVVFLEPYKKVFHELFKLCKISVVIPVSTASCERSFSALKLIKNHLRTTMADDRLSHLGILSVESRRAHTLNMDDFVKHFASSHQNRRIILS